MSDIYPPSAASAIKQNQEGQLSSGHKFSPAAMKNLSKGDSVLFQKYGCGLSVTPDYSCIHHAFEAMVLKYPDTIAVRDKHRQVSYRELNQQANYLAAVLSWNGVGVGDNVALFLQRSVSMVVGILATLKVGAAYVPQDGGVAPRSQLEHVIYSASTKIILTTSDMSGDIPIPDGHKRINIDEVILESKTTRENAVVSFQPASEVLSTHRCFVLFTSGTTGKPNGVQVTHGNICNILLTSPGNLSVQVGDKVSQILNIAFDMAAWEIFVCLAHGGTLIIRGDNIQAAAEQANVIIATPSVLAGIDLSRCHSVKVAAVAGEPCPKPLADNWSKRCSFYNSCGPTETTIINTAQRYSADCEQLTIGKPTPNNTVYVLDQSRQPCAIGEVGEMWAGGECVTAGYLNNESLNAERYVDDPFLGGGRKMFRTRDLGRWTQNGELEHLGRTDDQVKVRGFRVELDSVSVALESTPLCEQAVTLKLDNRHLVAFVSPATVDVQAAKEGLAKLLPYYCIPTFILALDKLPKTSRGKTDKRRLLEMAQEFKEKMQTATKSNQAKKQEMLT